MTGETRLTLLPLALAGVSSHHMSLFTFCVFSVCMTNDSVENNAVGRSKRKEEKENASNGED